MLSHSAVVAVVRPRTRTPADIFEEVFMMAVTRLDQAVNIHMERTTETIETIWGRAAF